MTYQTQSSNPIRSGVARVVRSPVVRTASLMALCAAYIQGPLTKVFDFNGALSEMDHFGLHPASFFAVAVIVFELTASAMVVSGFLRWAGALALAGFTLLATLVALRFWEMASGMDRILATNAFFEHVGLAGAFVFVAAFDLTKGAGK
ncbi:DoxX family protein [Rhizobium sp. L9]|uniref:DoxX family protein n=1 Tax=Rhizobium sp. L9 TaxID=1340738 RepID=UPI000BE95F10|nr:DoxX family protein [Rhizobium sp. L9]PDT27905.1 DoxX family protein [Rhizobium sp. L9]